MARVKTGPKNFAETEAIYRWIVELNSRMCRRYDWWAELSDKHWEHYWDVDATIKMVKLQRKIRRGEADAADHGTTPEELDEVIAAGKARWDEYDRQQGWLEEPKRMKQ
jgi:hypothetical protein